MATKIIPDTTRRAVVLESVPVDPALLTSANWWFDVSWYGLLIAGALTAFAALTTVIFLFIQFWSSGVKERHTEWRTTTLESETAKAKAELGKANADIAKANAEIADAKKQTAGLEKQTADAKERTAALEKEAAQARLEQERLKQIVKWRVLTPSQLRVLTDNLQAGGNANITYAANDPEALYLWTQISKAFPQPAWKMIAQARTYEGIFHAGIFISGPDIPATKTIRDAFTAAGIAFGTEDPGKPHMFFGEPNIPNAPTVFIASRFPAN